MPACRFLADVDMHAASDGQTLTTSGTVHIQNLKLRKGAAAAPKPLDLSYSGTHRLKENSGQIEDATAKIGDAAIHVNGTYQLDRARRGRSAAKFETCWTEPADR